MGTLKGSFESYVMGLVGDRIHASYIANRIRCNEIEADCHNALDKIKILNGKIRLLEERIEMLENKKES